MTRFRDAKVCKKWLQIGIDGHRVQSLTTSTKVNFKIQKERNLYLVLRLRGETEHDTNDNVTIKTQNTFNTAHMTRECAVLLFVCQVLVVMIHTLHRMAQGCYACHLIHA